MAILEEPHDRTSLVLYGSETGMAQDVAAEVGAIFERLHFSTRVVELNSVNISRLAKSLIVVIIISTTGQGDLPANAQTFWKQLLRRRLPPDHLSDVRFTTFGLGDSSYPKYNWAARKLHKRLIQLGAKEFQARGEADVQHPEGTDGSFIPWSADLRRHLLEAYEYPEGLSPIPDDTLLQPKWTLEEARGSGNAEFSRHSFLAETSTGRLENQEDGSQNESPPDLTPSDGILQGDTPPNDLLPIPGSITVNLDENDRVTAMHHWQDVRRITFSTSTSVDYEPGDVLTIFPKNFPQDVEDLISIMDWGHVADIPLRCVRTRTATGQQHDDPSPIPHLLPVPQLTLRNLLLHYLDITAIPRRSFFSFIAHFTDDPVHKERLLEFTRPQYLDELYDYTTRPRRSILEVLHDFRSVKIPWSWVGSVIPVLKGRQFSIASGGSLKRTSIEPGGLGRFELLVAIVKYRTVIKKVRQGVCSRYLSSLPKGTKLNVLLRKGGLNTAKTEARRPVIMVAPGTGVAPMRSLVYERLSWKEEEEGHHQDSKNIHTNGLGPSVPGIGDNVLFFGCRNKESDFFFREEWEELKSRLGLQVYTAFSRDQKKKVYVQDVIREQAEVVYRLLHDRSGIVYICGSSGKMPQAVREALIEVFQSQGAVEREDAEKQLLAMEKEGRYKQETW
ncbi:MAG: NAPDH-dependent diflavin reductase [Peltula sp. TS41687]|nr:MAG: NAPDH-dependent diflavin reductase [Peltula sp. TS41687]